MSYRIGIVACSKRKQRFGAPARELYTGRTFRAASDLLLRFGCERLVILSALHGALPDWQWVEPYECALKDMNKAERAAWATRTRAALKELLLPEAELLVILPAAYAEVFDGSIPRVHRLFAGLSQGRLYHALTTQDAVTAEWARWAEQNGGAECSSSGLLPSHP